MKTILFKNKEYSIPQNWGEVTVGMLIQASLLEEITENLELITVMSAYTGIPVKDLGLNAKDEVLEILAIMDFISKPYVPKPSNEFVFKGEKYSANPDITDQNFEDWVSIQTVLHNYKDEPVKGLTKLIAIYCKKNSETLDSFDLTERAKHFEDLPMTVARDVEAFFLHSKHAYEVVSQLSLITKEQEQLVLHKLEELRSTMKARLVQNGTSLRMKLLIGYYLIYLWYLKSLLVRYFNSTPIKPLKKTSTKIWKKLLGRMQRINTNRVIL
jgi:hypothetical protein